MQTPTHDFEPGEHSSRLTTEEAATCLRVKAQTLRAALCRDGHYFGIRPVRAANRFLLWPADEVQGLLAKGPLQ